MADFLVQEEDGTSKFTLEEGGGSLLLEEEPPQPDPYQPFLVRIPFKRLSPNRYVFNASVEGVEQTNDAGRGILVVPTWDGYRLARASRFYYQERSELIPPPEPPGGPPQPPRGRPFRRDGNLGFEDGARYRRNRYIWNGSVETLQVQPADTPTPFRARVRFQGYRQQNRHVFHYYYTQPVAPPVGGFRAGWADDSTITINARRIDRGVIV